MLKRGCSEPQPWQEKDFGCQSTLQHDSCVLQGEDKHSLSRMKWEAATQQLALLIDPARCPCQDNMG